MKKLLTLIVFALAYTGLSAQWIYTASDFPAVGTEQYYSTANAASFAPGNPGTGQTWNHDTLSPTNTTTWRMVTPSAAPQGASFPAATHAWVNSANDYRFYNVTPDTVFLMGEKSISSTVCHYSDSAGIIAFPFSFGTSFNDSVLAVYPDGFISNITRTGEIATSFDGAGTLITPYATYNNVIRIFRETSYNDSSWTGAANAVVFINEYEWYQQGIPFPVLYYKNQAVSINGGAPQISNTLLYADSQLVAIQEPVGPFNNMPQVFPNPTEGQTNIQLDLNQSTNLDIRVFGLDGKEVAAIFSGKHAAGSASFNLETATLSPGVYLVKINAGEYLHTEKLIVK